MSPSRRGFRTFSQEGVRHYPNNEQSPYRTFFLICAHAGLKTGEDGPTHADPQALQLLMENFPVGTVITLTPWDPQEMWVLVAAALNKRPAVIAPFVTRPSEKIIDRETLGLAPANAAAAGVYRLRKAQGKPDAALVLQGSEVAYAFIEGALPLLEKKGADLDVYYVASTELFDLLSHEEKERIFPEKVAQTAMGITGFTLPTMYRWIRSDRGRQMTDRLQWFYLKQDWTEKVSLRRLFVIWIMPDTFLGKCSKTTAGR
jgi:transketolase